MPPRKRPKAPAAKDVAHDPYGNGSDTDDEGGPNGGHRPAHNRHRQRVTTVTSGLVSSYFAPPRIVSSRSVADLTLAVGDEGSMRALVAALPERFPNEKAALLSRFEAKFGRWWAQWCAGHSLLFYGYGSKRALLQKFARECTGDGACLVVDGLSPKISARQILAWAAGLAKLMRPQHFKNASHEEMLEAVRSEGPRRKIYTVLHNIDGPGLRNTAEQRLLSELAVLPNVHFAASIDHVNAPLLWDLQTRDRFAWLWHHTATFQPYIEEVAAAAVPSVFIGQQAACTQQSALVVLSSLSHTAREVFRLVADAQLDPSGPGGVPFQNLFTTCRERFLVSNEILLKTFLTEFRDHDLLTSKRGQDGGDLLCVPLEGEALKGVLAEMQA